MINRTNLFFLGLLLIFVFYVGCTSPKTAENLSNPGSVSSFSSSGLSVPAQIKTPVSTASTIKTSETPKKWGANALVQNETVYDQLDSNTSYELYLRDITIQQNKTPGSEFVYTIKINVTAKNSGTVPIDITFLIEALKDNFGKGCQSDTPYWCGAIDLEMKPGESKNRISNITISSTKGYDNLTSQKFLLEGVINAQSDKMGTYNRRISWLIDLKKST